jgi:hypothetical protein
LRVFQTVILGLCALGCGAPPAGSFVKYNFGGGRYFVEIDDTQGGSSLTSDSKGEGTKTVAERHEIVWGEGRLILIVDGVLSVDGVVQGPLDRGARIKVTSAGDVFVNGRAATK